MSQEEIKAARAKLLEQLGAKPRALEKLQNLKPKPTQEKFLTDALTENVGERVH
jgi:hypothetical protein